MIKFLATISHSERDGLLDFEKSILTKFRTISFLSLLVRHSLLKHSSTSGLQCSGITDVACIPYAEETEAVSPHDRDSGVRDSGVRSKVDSSLSYMYMQYLYTIMFRLIS